ncbi:MAG: cytochrome c [Gammaproteobacteria bacterium]|nr:cytochrome c [Gammaproteobacteria bacterium]MBQ0839282.1 cytochrome c [Gammaproteobacteria bacterium]
MKATILAVSLLLVAGLVQATEVEKKHNMHHGHMAADDRTSLNLSPAMKQHQLKNMRAHLAAIQDIIVQLSSGNFAQASNTAHQKLGLTEEMAAMCNSFESETFKELGLGFHKSADELGVVLAKGNTEDSLAALGKTMTYCVACHAQFKQ